QSAAVSTRKDNEISWQRKPSSTHCSILETRRSGPPSIIKKNGRQLRRRARIIRFGSANTEAGCSPRSPVTSPTDRSAVWQKAGGVPLPAQLRTDLEAVQSRGREGAATAQTRLLHSVPTRGLAPGPGWHLDGDLTGW